MDKPKSAAARLRRTFAYPDDSQDSQPEAMDEEEQDHLITVLAHQNTHRNTQFNTLLLSLPLLATLPYIPSLLRPPTALFALLALTSLLSTAWLLRRLPPAETGIPWLDRWVRPRTPVGSPRGSVAAGSSSAGGGGGGGGGGGRHDTTPFAFEQARSPLEVYLPYLNLGLCVVLVLTGWVAGDREAEHKVWLVSLGNLPAVVLIVVLASKAVMGSVDPEKELSALKYDYKGA